MKLQKFTSDEVGAGACDTWREDGDARGRLAVAMGGAERIDALDLLRAEGPTDLEKVAALCTNPNVLTVEQQVELARAIVLEQLGSYTGPAADLLRRCYEVGYSEGVRPGHEAVTAVRQQGGDQQARKTACVAAMLCRAPEDQDSYLAPIVKNLGGNWAGAVKVLTEALTELAE